MRYLLLFFSVICCSSSSLFCQEISVGMGSGMATFTMSDLKEYNDDIFPEFDAKLVSDFPPFLYFQPRFKFTWLRFSFSVEYTYLSTGSRISAKDYSGEYLFDMMVHSNNAGIVLGWELMRQKKGRMIAAMKSGFAFSGLKTKYYLELQNSVISEITKNLTALHYFFEPCLEYSYFVLPKISLSLHTGYYFDIGDKPFKTDFTLTNPENRNGVGPDWKGFRIGIGLNYAINQRL